MSTRRAEEFPLRRREVAKLLNDPSRQPLIVTGAGSATYDVAAAGDGNHVFPFWNALGGPVPAGLGLALAQPARRVLVVLGDGDMLMGVGAFATVAVAAPANLAICVFDNEHYGETGMQATHTAYAADLAAAAQGLGVAKAFTVRGADELDAAINHVFLAPGPVVVVFKVRAEKLNFVTPPRDGVYLKNRFRLALLGPGGVN